MYFDLDFNYLRSSVEQMMIVPDAPPNWESESCKLIPYVRYEYTRVSKKDPASGRGLQRINRAREKLKLFASVAKNQGSVLRIVNETIVTELYPANKAITQVELTYLEESYGSLVTDPVASTRKTREMPSHLKRHRKKTKR